MTWKLGYAKTDILPDNFGREKFYMAGYVFNTVATDVHDAPAATASWLQWADTATVLVSLDLMGFINADVQDVRVRLAHWMTRNGCGSLNIVCTHNHAALDTIGLFGDMGIESGRNAAYVEEIKQKIIRVVEQARQNARPGALYVGDILAGGTVKDIREPYVTDERLTRFRFVPDDGTCPTHLYHFTCHPEGLAQFNTTVSADYVYFFRQAIEAEGVNFMFINGAVGGMQTIADFTGADGKVLTKWPLIERMGAELGRYALAIDNERPLPGGVRYTSRTLTLPLDNVNYVALMEMGMVDYDMQPCPDSQTGLAIPSDASVLWLGDYTLCLVPGELFPELVTGQYLDDDLLAHPERPRETPLRDIAKAEHLLVVGLANDEVGYILPACDFYVSPTRPFQADYDEQGVQTTFDSKGRNHYEETNSLSKDTAKVLFEAFESMINEGV